MTMQTISISSENGAASLLAGRRVARAPVTPAPQAKEPSPIEELKAKIVLAGAPGVGKTSIVRRYVLNEFEDKYKSTLGAIVYKRTADVPVTSRIVRVTMTVWDAMGTRDGPNPMRDIDLYGAQGVLAVCDVTDPGSVPALRFRVGAVARAAGDIPMEILMNKADLGPVPEVRTASLRTGLERGIPCYLTSAKEGDNVESAFEDLARRVVERNLFPTSSPFDDVDRGLLVLCASRPVPAEDVAVRCGLPPIFAEARLERLRRRGYLSLAGLGLDRDGRPRASYGRTRKPFQLSPIAAR